MQESLLGRPSSLEVCVRASDRITAMEERATEAPEPKEYVREVADEIGASGNPGATVMGLGVKRIMRWAQSRTLRLVSAERKARLEAKAAASRERRQARRAARRAERERRGCFHEHLGSSNGRPSRFCFAGRSSRVWR